MTADDRTWPRVSVVMPVRNEARHLPNALDALLGGDYPAHRMEVLVVDGDSTDGTRAIVGRYAECDRRVRLLDNPRRTTPAGLNIGLAAAGGEIVVRLDGHTRPAPDYVRASVAALQETGADVVGGMMVGRGETPFGEAVALATQTPLGAGDARFRLGGAGPTDTVYLGAWRRDRLRALGGFDEALARNQDYELCERIRRAGGVVWLSPAVRSTTVTRGTPRALAAQYLGYGLGRAGTLMRHPGSLRARQAVPALFVGALALAGPAAVRGRAGRRALAALLGPYGLLVGLTSLRLAARAGWRHLRRLPLVFVVLHVAWGVGLWLGLVRRLADRIRGRGGAPPS